MKNYVKSFQEFINEGIMGANTDTIEELYAYLQQNYECLDGKNIETETGNSHGVDWIWLTIPLTTDGDVMETELWVEDPTKAFALNIPKKLEQYLVDETYDEIEEIDWDEEKVGDIRVMCSSMSLSNEEIINILDGLLNNLPNPAMRKVSE